MISTSSRRAGLSRAALAALTAVGLLFGAGVSQGSALEATEVVLVDDPVGPGDAAFGGVVDETPTIDPLPPVDTRTIEPISELTLPAAPQEASVNSQAESVPHADTTDAATGSGSTPGTGTATGTATGASAGTAPAAATPINSVVVPEALGSAGTLPPLAAVPLMGAVAALLPLMVTTPTDGVAQPSAAASSPVRRAAKPRSATRSTPYAAAQPQGGKSAPVSPIAPSTDVLGLKNQENSRSASPLASTGADVINVLCAALLLLLGGFGVIAWATEHGRRSN